MLVYFRLPPTTDGDDLPLAASKGDQPTLVIEMSHPPTVGTRVMIRGKNYRVYDKVLTLPDNIFSLPRYDVWLEPY